MKSATISRRALLWSACPVVALAQSRPLPERRAWPGALPMPSWSANDLSGQTRSSQSWQGRPLLLNFWASWCEPCKAEMASLQLLETQFEPQGLAVVLVNFKESLGTVKRFMEATSLDLPVLLDPQGQVAKAWSVRAFPTSFLIDRAGRVRWRVEGEADWQQPAQRAWIEQHLKESS